MNATPRVIHLVISLAAGGLERLVVNWTNTRNHAHPGSTTVCCLDCCGEFSDQVEGDPVVCLQADRSRRPFDVRAVMRLRALLRHEGGTVLHSHNAAAWQYGVLGSQGLGVRHVHTEHGSNPHEMGLVNRIRNACLWRLTDAVVTVADSAAHELARKQGIPLSRIRVIPNGVSRPTPEDCRPQTTDHSKVTELRHRFHIARDAPVIGSVGRLAHVKGYDRLIKAIAMLADPSVVLLLVGDGPERETIKTLAVDHGIAERVIFAGYQSDPARYLSAMDLFVLPSRSEGVSISLLEAMANGVPVAATDVGANREVLDGGGSGVLLPGDEKEWAGLLAGVLADRDGARLRSNAAVARVQAHYSLKATLAAYEGLYAGASPIKN